VIHFQNWLRPQKAHHRYTANSVAKKKGHHLETELSVPPPIDSMPNY
jgi:hypothetical protein